MLFGLMIVVFAVLAIIAASYAGNRLSEVRLQRSIKRIEGMSLDELDAVTQRAIKEAKEHQ